MNNVTLVGRITKEPSLKQSKQNQNYVRFTIAIDQYTSRGKVAEFIPCIAFGKTAEFVSKHASKGSYVSVQGALHCVWKKVNNVDYRDTNVYVSRLALLTGWKNGAVTNQNQQPVVFTMNSQQAPVNTNESTETVPFVSQEPPIASKYDSMDYFDIAEDDLPF